MSAVNHYETSVVVFGHLGLEGLKDLELLIQALRIKIVPFDALDAQLATSTYQQYGKGIHPARLNLGDCPPYALAKKLAASLLFVGNDFAKTDVTTAIQPHW